MPKFKLKREFSGYAYGVDTVEVEAETLWDASNKAYISDYTREITRVKNIEAEKWEPVE